jgi:hypothetical protein
LATSFESELAELRTLMFTPTTDARPKLEEVPDLDEVREPEEDLLELLDFRELEPDLEDFAEDDFLEDDFLEDDLVERCEEDFTAFFPLLPDFFCGAANPVLIETIERAATSIVLFKLPLLH